MIDGNIDDENDTGNRFGMKMTYWNNEEKFKELGRTITKYNTFTNLYPEFEKAALIRSKAELKMDPDNDAKLK